MRKLFITIIFFAALPVFGQPAEGIVKAARNRIDAKTITTRSRMELTAKNGGKTERLIDQFSKDSADGKKIFIVFQKPAGVAGTRFLTVTQKSSADSKWIFLPSLGRTRRISASEGSGSFVGTDLSYDDVSSADRDVTLDTHTLLREETLKGKPCYVIQSVPKDSAYQYSKMIQWIGKADSITWKIELYDQKGNLKKILEVLEVKTVQGYETPVRTKMSTLSAGTSTEIFVEDIKYNGEIPDGVFTQNYLETGKL